MSSKNEIYNRRADVLKRYRFSNASLYRYIRKGDFPKPVYLGPDETAPRWRESDLSAYESTLQQSLPTRCNAHPA